MEIPSIANKKGSNGVFSLMIGAALAVAVVFIVLTISADILQGVRDTQTADTASGNTSDDSLDAIANFASQGGNIGLIVGVGILLLVLVAIFGRLATGAGGNAL